MAENDKQDGYENALEIFLGKPNKYEHIRADIKFIDVFKNQIIRDDKLRRNMEKRTGQKFFPSWRSLTAELAEREVNNKRK